MVSSYSSKAQELVHIHMLAGPHILLKFGISLFLLLVADSALGVCGFIGPLSILPSSVLFSKVIL